MANNQLSAAELEELKKLYRDIDSYNQSQAEAAALHAQNIGVARTELERLRREYTKLASDVSDALGIFHDITQEISKQNLGINESKKGYRGLTSIAEKIQQYQQGITNLSSKEVEKLKDKVKQEQLRLKNTQNLLDLNRQEQETLKARNEAIQISLENQIRQAQRQGAFTGYLDHRLQIIRDRHKSIEKELTSNSDVWPLSGEQSTNIIAYHTRM